jgi:FAD/FMN-containing dehydrogenase
MERRALLKGAAALPLLALPALPPPVAAAQEPAPKAPRTGPAPRPRAHLARVRPGDPGWPSAASWQKLNDLVGGNLLKVGSLFEQCRREPDGAACREVLANIHNPFYIGDQPSGTEVSGWLDAWTPAPSVYAIKARNTADVVAGVNFARDNQLRLVVKGTGHSYLGTSNAPDSLLIWTRAMSRVTLHDAFVGSGCAGKAEPLPAVTAEAGATWIDLYSAVTTRAGRYVQGGGCTSVGVAGLVQSGGFGSNSKGFGTAASGLLEAEIVTADGRALTVNACMNPDLFWAIKGGGGGSWGVITRLTLRTHALPEFFGYAYGKIKAHSDEAFTKLLARFFDFYVTGLFNPHWGEQVHIGPDNTLKVSMVSQGVGKTEAGRLWQPFFDWVSAAPRDFSIADEVGAGATAARHWWDVEGNPSMIQDKRAGASRDHGWWEGDQDQVGAYLHGYDSLWLPAALLKPQAQASLVAALFAGSRFKEIELHFNKGLAGAAPGAIAAALDTATNPAVTEAFALAIIADGEGAAYPGMARPAMDLEAAHRDARAIERATAELRKVAPDAGSYVSESNFFNKRWQQDYWGEHYPKLQAIKKRYDPEGLFFVHNGVGSEDWSADGFTRLA